MRLNHQLIFFEAQPVHIHLSQSIKSHTSCSSVLRDHCFCFLLFVSNVSLTYRNCENLSVECIQVWKTKSIQRRMGERKMQLE